MIQIRGIPAYSKKFQSEVLAMVKQLDCPTFFLCLSCADLYWNALVEVITKLKNTKFSEEQMSLLDYSQSVKY